MGPELLQHIDGMFSFVLYDANKDIFFAARDHVGITTLYYGLSEEDGSIWFASEMKSLNEDCQVIHAFPPGHYMTGPGALDSPPNSENLVEYYHPKWYDDKENNIPDLSQELSNVSKEEEEAIYKRLRESLERSVKKRLMAEVPHGVLLSGGLDSSLIAAIAVRQMKNGDAGETDEDIICT
jgi:asparagine synthase (glutamine-hydrolysing)